MSTEHLPLISFEVKRLLGIGDGELLAHQLKKELFRAREREAAFDAINTSLLFQKSTQESKRGVIVEVIKKHLLPSELLRIHPMVYIGSGADIEYPLALGGRTIIMVDPILEDNTVIHDVIGRVERIIKAQTDQASDGRISFRFDFGDGRETVMVKFVAKPYLTDKKEEDWPIAENSGAIILFVSQGSDGAARVDASMKSRLVYEGIVWIIARPCVDIFYKRPSVLLRTKAER